LPPQIFFDACLWVELVAEVGVPSHDQSEHAFTTIRFSSRPLSVSLLSEIDRPPQRQSQEKLVIPLIYITSPNVYRLKSKGGFLLFDGT